MDYWMPLATLLYWISAGAFLFGMVLASKRPGVKWPPAKAWIFPFFGAGFVFLAWLVRRHEAKVIVRGSEGFASGREPC